MRLKRGLVALCLTLTALWGGALKQASASSSGNVWAFIVSVAYAISIAIGAAVHLGLASEVGAFIFCVDNTISVGVRATHFFSRPRKLGAFIIDVWRTVLVGIRAAGEVGVASGIGAAIFVISDAIHISIGATIGG